MTILEPGEDESGPSDLLCDIVQHDHDRQCRQACGEEQQPILGESAQRREAIEDRDCDQEDQQPSKQADQIPAALDVIISPKPPAVAVRKMSAKCPNLTNHVPRGLRVR